MNKKIFRKYIFLGLLILFSCRVSFCFDTINNNEFEDEEINDQGNYFKWEKNFFEAWNTWPTFNFTIYYFENNEEIEKVIDGIDALHASILEDLDFAFFFNPKKIKVYIYRSNVEYHLKTGMSQWAGGHSSFKEGAVYTYVQKDTLSVVLAHELSHMIFDAYINFPKKINASWLHEGIALYEERKYKKSKNKEEAVWDIKELKEKSYNNELIPLKKALRSNMGLEHDSKVVSLWYVEMGTLVAFMMEKGRKGFYVFCENLKRYNNVDEALSQTYPWDFHNMDDLERKWIKWLRNQKDQI